jgi:hypothetical protein
MNNNYKIGIWAVVVAVLALGFWYNIDQWLNHSGSLSYSNWNVLSLMFLIFLLSSISIGLILFRNKYLSLGILALAILPQLLLFGFSFLNILGLVLFIFLGYNTRSRINNEVEQRIKFRTGSIIRNSLKPLILGIFLVVSFSAYQSSAFESVQKRDRVPSISETFAREIIGRMIGQDYKLDAQQTDQVIKQTITETNKQINNMFSPYLKYAPPVLAFVLFVVLYGLNWIFLWLSALLCVGAVALLRMMRFIRIEERDIKAEMLIV